MRNIIRQISFLTILLFLVACGNENIYVDVPSQSVKTCGGENFKSIRITREDGKGSLRIERKAGMKGTNSLNLFVADSNYSYGAAYYWDDSTKFAIKPSSTYLITNETSGDASRGEVTFKTDSLGRICYSSRVRN